jgi:hypothetical protein
MSVHRRIASLYRQLADLHEQLAGRPRRSPIRSTPRLAVVPNEMQRQKARKILKEVSR